MQLIFCNLNRLFSEKKIVNFLSSKFFTMNTKKRQKTKAQLLKAVRSIIAKGQKASVSSITKKANLAYGTFYRYFKDLDEIYYEAIEELLFELAVKLERDLKNIYPAPPKSLRNLVHSN